jgi:hypothetical protein
MSAPKSDAATIQARRHRLLELLAAGKTQSECSAILIAEGYPAHRRTLWLDIQELQENWVEANAEAYAKVTEKYRQAQLEELESLRDELLELKEKAKEITDPETQIQLLGALNEHNLKILDREMRLIGSDKSPSRFGFKPGEDGVVREIKITVAENPGQHQLPPPVVVKQLPEGLEDELPEELKLP